MPRQRYETVQIHSLSVAGRNGRTGVFVACAARGGSRRGAGGQTASLSHKLMKRSAPINSFHLSPFTLHLPLPMPAIITANCYARKTIRRTRCDASSMPPIPARTTTISSDACIAIWAPSAIWQVISPFRTTCTRGQPIVFLQITTRSPITSYSTTWRLRKPCLPTKSLA